MIKFLVISLIFVPIVILITKSNLQNISVWILVLLFAQSAVYSIWDYVVKRNRNKKQLN
ncbi:hypothetical protein [Bacillus sp. AFS002410]|uniref:hypothetical protein n=1 Tax=Bacillus sp. AFS002410 TaxID=2033481 RepID=UPI0015CF77D2|nr:hypothetical protein [Bacillus sp. AFS002410]